MKGKKARKKMFKFQIEFRFPHIPISYNKNLVLKNSLTKFNIIKIFVFNGATIMMRAVNVKIF